MGGPGRVTVRRSELQVADSCASIDARRKTNPIDRQSRTILSGSSVSAIRVSSSLG
jgi:ribosome-binding protein aMBF1 (putative translation factor)